MTKATGQPTGIVKPTEGRELALSDLGIKLDQILNIVKLLPILAQYAPMLRQMWDELVAALKDAPQRGSPGFEAQVDASVAELRDAMAQDEHGAINIAWAIALAQLIAKIRELFVKK